MIAAKQNIAVFDADARENEGYRYTTHAKFSSRVANERMTRATLVHIDQTVKTVLDVGCGDGTYTGQIKATRPGLSLLGFDPAGSAIEQAALRNPDVLFAMGDILKPETFPTPAGFDLVIIRGVLHHLPTPAAAIANCRQLGKRLLIIEPNGNNPILKLIERLSKYHRDHEEQSFSSGTLRQWCIEAGYRVDVVEFIGFVPFFFPTIVAKVIHILQPLLERIPLLGRFFGAQIVLVCNPAAE